MKKRVFDLKSVVLLVMIFLLAIANVLNIIFTPKIIKIINSPEISYAEQQTQGEIQPLDINVLLDASGSGWKSVLNEELLEKIVAPFQNFSEQSHRIMFNSFSANIQNKSSSVFVDTSDKEALEDLISVYKSMYQSNGADVAYSQMISDGIKYSDKSAKENGRKNIVILITRSYDFHKVTSANADSVKMLIEDYNASLYCVGLESYDSASASTYQSMELLTDNNNIFREVNVNFVSNIISQIVRKEAYSKLLNDTNIVINSDNPNQLMHELKIDLYSGSKVSGFLQKVVVNKSNETSYVKIGDINLTNESFTLRFDKDDLKDISLPYTFKFVWDDAFNDVRYKVTYRMYNQTYNQIEVNAISQIIVCILSALMLIVMITLIVRLVNRLKLRKQAQRAISNGALNFGKSGGNNGFALVRIFVKKGSESWSDFYKIYDCNDDSQSFTTGHYNVETIIRELIKYCEDFNINMSLFYQNGKLYCTNSNNKPEEFTGTKEIKCGDYTVIIQRMV